MWGGISQAAPTVSRAIGACCGTLNNSIIIRGFLGLGDWRGGSCPALQGPALAILCPSLWQQWAPGSGSQGCLQGSVQGRSWLRTAGQGAASPCWPQYPCHVSRGAQGTPLAAGHRTLPCSGPSAELTGWFYDRGARLSISQVPEQWQASTLA